MPSIKKAPRRPWLPERKAQARRTVDNSAVYNSTRWRRLRLLYLGDNPLCVQCESNGLSVAATVVDHIRPISQGGAVWDRSNWQGLCSGCHARKSGREAHQRAGDSSTEGEGGVNP